MVRDGRKPHHPNLPILNPRAFGLTIIHHTPRTVGTPRIRRPASTDLLERAGHQQIVALLVADVYFVDVVPTRRHGFVACSPFEDFWMIELEIEIHFRLYMIERGRRIGRSVDDTGRTSHHPLVHDPCAFGREDFLGEFASTVWIWGVDEGVKAGEKVDYRLWDGLGWVVDVVHLL